jgi:hypothetical protein
VNRPDYRSPACARPGCIRRSDAIYFPFGGGDAYTLCPKHGTDDDDAPGSDDYWCWLYGDQLSLDRDLGGWLRHLERKNNSMWDALWQWLQTADGRRWRQRGDGTVVSSALT